MRIEISPGRTVEYIEGFLSKEEADRYLRAFLELKSSITPEVVTMFGRSSLQKRLSVQYGADYIYNRTAKKSQPWTPLMLEIRARMEAVAGPLDGDLLWIYPDGEAGLGWHEDKGKPEIIASLSFGAEREFAFGVGPVVGCQEVYRMRLAHGSLLLIPGETNEATKHRVPPERRVKEPRVAARATNDELRAIRRKLGEQLSEMKQILAKPGCDGQWSGFLRERNIPRATADRLVARHQRALDPDENCVTEDVSEPTEEDVQKLFIAVWPKLRRTLRSRQSVDLFVRLLMAHCECREMTDHELPAVMHAPATFDPPSSDGDSVPEPELCSAPPLGPDRATICAF